MNELKIGTVVELKSGSPKMTVTGYRWDPDKGSYDKSIVYCKWFDSNEVKHAEFPSESLIAVEESN